MSEKKFFVKQGFKLGDTAEPYFELWYKAFKKDAPIPRFKEVAKNASSPIQEGIAIYYTAACPFTDYYVKNLEKQARQKGYKVQSIHLKTRQQAQNHFVPHTIYSVFQDGKFVTQHIINEKHFHKYIQ